MQESLGLQSQDNNLNQNPIVASRNIKQQVFNNSNDHSNLDDLTEIKTKKDIKKITKE